MTNAISNAISRGRIRKRSRSAPTITNGRAFDSATSCAGAMSSARSARRAMALCCVLLLTKSPTITPFQINSGAHARGSRRDIHQPRYNKRLAELRATRESPTTTQSDKSGMPIKDVDGSNDDDDGISDEDRMKIPLMNIDADEDIVEKTISDGSDLPGSADAFDYAWDRSSQAFLDWTSGTSIGSFLLQRQREEEDAAIIRGVDSQTGQAEYSTDLGGNGGSSSPPRAKESSEQLVRDQSRRMEGRKRRKERRKERMVEAQLEELREQQRTRQQQVGGVQIIDDTATSGVGKQIIDDEKSSAVDGSRRRRRRKDDGDMEERKSRARLWRRRKRDRAKARQKAFDVDRELANQVDDAITPLKADRPTIMNQIDVLEMTDTEIPSRVRVVMPPSAEDKIDSVASTTKPSRREALKKYLRMKSDMKRLPLSDPEHYRNRIDKDMRHMAIVIASNVDFDWQWRLFCEEGGGLYPLIHCIRDGANRIREGESLAEEEGEDLFGLSDQHQEAVAAATAACRNLRDLCSLSPEFSAVVTDGILRADAALSMAIPNEEEPESSECLSGGLLSDLITLLRYGQRGLQPFPPSSTAPSSTGPASPKPRSQVIKEKLGIGVNNGKKKPVSPIKAKRQSRRAMREARARSALYVVQLLLAMSVASDASVNTMRATSGLTDTVVGVSSYAPKEKFRRRWIRYPVEVVKKRLGSNKNSHDGTTEDGEPEEEDKTKPFIAAAKVAKGIEGEIQRTSNMLLAAIGHNIWVPKSPNQRGLRILSLDGGGSRGITAITSMSAIVEAMGGIEVADSFDIIAGTSTGAIISFLVGLRRETSGQAKKRYDKLISRIFVKSALSGPMMVFTTAAYDERHFNEVMEEVLGDTSMLESRADPAVPLVFCISSKMSSNPIQISLFRNYNYGGSELADSFTIDPEKARIELGLPQEDDIMAQLSDWEEKGQVSGRCPPRRTIGSRHSGSFRILQRAALRATTAAPTFFKPVMMGGELYSDGGIVASNPAAVAIHEARTLFPDIPIEMVVSCGTGGFIEEKTPPKIGWDGIIGQIVKSATDGEQIHHILEDIMGEGGTAQLGKSSVSQTKYYRFNPIVGTGDEFPIDVTEPEKLERLAEITKTYMNKPEQKKKLKEIVDTLEGRNQGWRKVLSNVANRE